IYAYLKPFDGLPRLLSLLRELRCPTLVFASGIDPRLIRQFQCDTLRFETKPLDLEQTAQQCDVAIVHGGHGTTASLLRAGKPLLVLPFHLEQALTGAAVRRMGAGLSARMRRPEEVAVKLMNLLHEPKYAQAAGRFAHRHADQEPSDQVQRMIRRVAELTNTS
ncbi:MAG: hypothetical protein HQ582_32860, partial [Planctomycetes bacterium]|nr:hypothetical protein [Planctomycetota bacterium]